MTHLPFPPYLHTRRRWSAPAWLRLVKSEYRVPTAQLMRTAFTRADSDLPLVHQRQTMRAGVCVRGEVVSDPAFTLVSNDIVDVSQTGIFARCASSSGIELGTLVIVALQVPRSRHWIDAEGTISRITWGRRQSDAGCGVGIVFHNISAVDQAILSAALRALPPPPPRRPLRRDYAASVCQLDPLQYIHCVSEHAVTESMLVQ